jgi:hypothetical protein
VTISIKVNSNGKVQTIYQGDRSGNWAQLPDDELPTVSEDNVSKTYWYDGEALRVETEPLPADDDLG